MKKIIIDKEIVDAFTKNAEFQSAISRQLQVWAERETKLWDALANKLKIDMTGARIKRETNELVLPFEDAPIKDGE